jgi:hypothetical protein
MSWEATCGLVPRPLGSPARSRAAQRLQAADVEADKRLGVLALPFEDVANESEVPARLVDASPSLATRAMFRFALLGRETAGAASTIMPRRTCST